MANDIAARKVLARLTCRGIGVVCRTTNRRRTTMGSQKSSTITSRLSRDFTELISAGPMEFLDVTWAVLDHSLYLLRRRQSLIKHILITANGTPMKMSVKIAPYSRPSWKWMKHMAFPGRNATSPLPTSGGVALKTERSQIQTIMPTTFLFLKMVKYSVIFFTKR